MKVDCFSCGYEINLNHRVFDDYAGPVRCYRCSAMMEIRTAQGLLCSAVPLKASYPGQTACDRVDTPVI
jgi:hypothetical protein